LYIVIYKSINQNHFNSMEYQAGDSYLGSSRNQGNAADASSNSRKSCL